MGRYVVTVRTTVEWVGEIEVEAQDAASAREMAIAEAKDGAREFLHEARRSPYRAVARRCS